MPKKNKLLFVVLIMVIISTLGIGLIQKQTYQQVKTITANAGGTLTGGNLGGADGSHQYTYFPRNFLRGA